MTRPQVAAPPPPPAPTPAPAPRGAWGLKASSLGLAGMLFITAVGGGAVGATLTRTDPLPAAAVTMTPAGPTITPIQPVQTSGSVAADVYRKVGPAVVQVTQQRGGGLFGIGGGGTGSGFIIDKDGSILTNNRRRGLRLLTVTLSDGREFSARVLGRSPENDVALIKIEPPSGGLTVAELADSAAVAPGDIAIAIGSLLGLDKTVTSGIVSAVNRDVNSFQVSLKGPHPDRRRDQPRATPAGHC